MSNSNKDIIQQEQLFNHIKRLIDDSKLKISISINYELSILYWHIGKSINVEILKDSRAEYGKKIIISLSKELTNIYGKGWSERQLHYCIQFSEIFSDETILHTLCAELNWSHIRQLLHIKDPIKRNFYIEICKIEKWSSRQLKERINSLLYERTAISKKPEKTIINDLDKLNKKGKYTADLAFRDPYLLDFLGLSEMYSEKDLESAILAELQKFIVELGNDFAFLARQKRITIDNRDYFMDLLFYHRRLKCLVVIELKIGEFEASYKGQVELYLRYLEKYEMIDGENAPIGLILCTGKNEEHIELLKLDESNIKIAEYLTVLPPKELLLDKLNKSIEIARNRLIITDNDWK